MAIGVCRQCVLYMATHRRLRATACATTPARVRSTAPQAHTLPVPSRTAPCTPPVLSRIILTTSALRSTCARPSPPRCSPPSVVAASLHRSRPSPLSRCIVPRPSLARCCAAFLPPVCIAAAQCPHDSSSPSALELHYKELASLSTIPAILFSFSTTFNPLLSFQKL